MSDKLRKAVQLVLALHDLGMHPDSEYQGHIVRLDPMAEQQLRAALEEPEFPWDGQDIEVNQVWSSRDPDGTCPYPGDEGEIQVNMLPADLIDLILHGKSDANGNVVTAVTIFTALPEPEFTPEEIDMAADIAALRALQHAANGLNYRQFCDALGWPEDDYTRDKFKAFQALGALGVFDGQVLGKLMGYYKLLNDVRHHDPDR